MKETRITQRLIILSLGLAINAFAGSATWKTQPPSTIWNDAANWSPATIPNGPADNATFATSQRRSITTIEPTEVDSIVFSPSGAAFTITTGVGSSLTVSGAGIINNSNLTQSFISPAGALPIFFTNSASAGSQASFTNGGGTVSGGAGGLTQFSGSASAGSALLTNSAGSVSGGLGGMTQFNGTASAESATITNNGAGQTGGTTGGLTEFLDDATAGQATLTNKGGLVTIAYAGMTIFRGNSTAGTASITNEEGAIIAFNGTTYFYDNASADHATFYANGGIAFYDNSTAANGVFVLGGPNGGGGVTFLDTATAADGTFTLLEDGGVTAVESASLGNAIMTSNGATEFGYGSAISLSDTATADHATLIISGGIFPGQPTSKGMLSFQGNSTAAEATLILNPTQVVGAVGGTASFGSGASAGNSNITVNGAPVTGNIAQASVSFSSSSQDENGTAGNASIVATGGSNGGNGGQILFLRNGMGGTSRIQLLGNAQLSMAPDRTRDLTIGSLEGEGTVFLGGHGLSIGSNNLSTVFSSPINDGQGGNTSPGFLIKIGTGTLELAGPTAYTGGTTVSAGILVVSNQTGSATGTGPVQVNSGTLGGRGIVAGAVTIGNGSSSGAILAPAHGTTRQATFTTQSTLTFSTNSSFIVTFKAKPTKTKTDTVVANGVTINSGVSFSANATVLGTLPPGLSLTLINNTAAMPIAGTFSNLPDGAILNVNGNNFQASYSGGDGNDLTLTVVS